MRAKLNRMDDTTARDAVTEAQKSVDNCNKELQAVSNNLAASFTKADNGEQVLIRRKNEIYASVKVGREDLMITPELQARIDKAREEIKSGYLVFSKADNFYFIIAHDISLVSLHAVSFEVVGCCSNLCN